MTRITRDILEIARCTAQHRSDKLAPMELKPCHSSYLTEICANPGISQDGLAKRICINKSNVARQAAILEEEGYITRSPSPSDKRVLELYPTAKALELLPSLQQMDLCIENYLTQDFTMDEIQLFSDLLQKMKVRCTVYMEDR